MRKLARRHDADRLRSAGACGGRPGYGAAALIGGLAIGALAGAAPLIEPFGPAPSGADPITTAIPGWPVESP